MSAPADLRVRQGLGQRGVGYDYIQPVPRLRLCRYANKVGQLLNLNRTFLTKVPVPVYLKITCWSSCGQLT